MKNIPKRPTLILARVQSYKRFRDVARCIQLVSLATLKRLRKKIVSRHMALSAIKTLFDADIYGDTDYYNDKRISIIAVTTEKSCSGIVNNRVNRNIMKFYLSVIDNVKFTHFIFLGKKGLLNMRRRFKKNVSFKVFRDLEKDINSLFISYLIVNSLRKKKFDTLVIYFNKYENGFDSKIARYRIDSFDLFFFNIYSPEQPKRRNVFVKALFEKNVFDDFFFIELYYFSLCLILLDALEENNYSELAARAQSMDAAVTNTTERIDYLTLVYNKTRQALITNEIIEILNASSAIK